MSTLAARALPAHRCPLCGGPNACAPAASGQPDAPCWCRQVVFDPDVLARVPADQKGLACICAACASAAAKARRPGA